MKNITPKYFIFSLLILLLPAVAYAQYDSIVNRMQREFDVFKQGIEQEHQQFRNVNDSLFSSFLKDSWETFNSFYKSQPEKPKPVLQPVAPKSEVPKVVPDSISPSDSLKTGSISEPVKINIKAQQSEQPPGYDKMGALPASINFYGTTPTMFLPTGLPHITQLSGADIARFFERVAPTIQLEQVLMQLEVLKKDMLLNDWGYLKLTQATARQLYSQPVEQTLMTWVLMLKSGYNVKVGYTSDQVYLMLPSIHDMYNSWYMTVNNTTYYLLTESNKSKSFPELTVHRADYPGTQAFSLALSQLPRLGVQTISKNLTFRDKTYSIPVNLQLIKFYEDYPLSNLEIFFATQLSSDIINAVGSILNPMLADLDTLQKVVTLLQFTQGAFAYKTDGEQFGREKFFFPDELFYYPYSDCEDRSVLFARLIKHFTQLNCVGLEFPNHVNTAVLIPGYSRGTEINIEGKHFTVCDPTYRNAPPGYLAEEYKEVNPIIITFD
jgi:hypothetical protein